MAFIELADIHPAYQDATKDADIWRINYPEYERLMDNGLLEDLDENLPEVNDGSLAAALFKLPKRVYNDKLSGKCKAIDRDDQHMSVLGDLIWRKHIVKGATSQAPFSRKWKDAVRKAAGYGSQPIITLYVERGNYTGADFIVPQATDVKLESGKVSDYDCDIIFWDVYYTKQQVQGFIDQAKEDEADAATELKAWQTRKAQAQAAGKPFDEDEPAPYNKWDSDTLQVILDSKTQEERPGNEEHRSKQDKGVKRSGIHFYIAFQRGVNAPFHMIHPKFKDKPVRSWSNPDPTGDLPVHYLYCYQDFINPYGIGIVRLAGGTQNILDYMRQSDVLATQIGIRPPKLIEGDTTNLDFDSLTYTEDANWELGNAKLTRMEMANGVYSELPNRISMYKTSLNQLIPTGDTSITSQSGDPNYSKTPAGVKFQQASLSIDDEDFKDNLYVTYAAVARSMINTHFANMQGDDLLKLDDDERKLLEDAGVQFPQNDQGETSNQLKVTWDDARASFDFEVDPSSGVQTNDADQLAQLQEALKTMTPQVSYYLGQDGWKFNLGAAYYSVFNKMNLENLDDIITKMSDEEQQQAKQAPFPIVDPPVIHINSANMTAEQLAASLSNGGVSVPGQQQPQQPGGPPAGLSPQGMADFMVEMAKAQGAAQPTEAAPAAPQGPSPDELALKQQELAIKQQQADHAGIDLTLKAHQQGHQQAMEKEKFLQQVEQSKQQASLAEKQAKQQPTTTHAKRPAGAAK